jgi:glycosyltransferase involved in cell wall biosynthesis
VSTNIAPTLSDGLLLPRVLVLSDEGPNLRSAGGILLYRLFKEYRSDKLFVIERDADPSRRRLDCKYASLVAPWRRFEQSRYNRWKRSMRGFGLVPAVPMERINSLLSGFKPDLVLCVMQHAAYYDTAWRYARLCQIPLVVIVHDVNEQFEPVLPWAVDANRRKDGEFYRHAARRLCVSTEMETLCAMRYGVRGDVLYPNRSEDLLPRPFEDAASLKSPGRLTVGFVGNLNYGYGDELVRLLPVFRSTGARLIAFGQPPGRSCAALLEATDCFEFRGFAPSPQDAWRAIQSDCDAVILPYPNPAGKMDFLYRHHFPSKLPEYLALGMPVIVTGPDYATGVKWSQQHSEAIATYSAPDIDGIRRLLNRLRSSNEYRVRLAMRGFEAGNRDFDPIAIKSQFEQCLLDVASKVAPDSRSSSQRARVEAAI